LVFQLYRRPLHPELFVIAAQKSVEACDHKGWVRITPTGHAVTWFRPPGFYLTEVLNVSSDNLPSNGLFCHRVTAEHHARAEPWPGVRYQASFQVEVLPPHLFLLVHEELLADGRTRGLMYRFPDRVGCLEPLGFVTIDGRPGLQLIHTFHTFPEEYSIVKSQSLIEHW
jgi:hypothetical protein